MQISPNSQTNPARCPLRTSTDASASTSSTPDPARKRLIRLPELLARTGLSRTVIYELIKAKSFPRPIKVGSASLWVDSDVSAWIERLQMARDANE